MQPLPLDPANGALTATGSMHPEEQFLVQGEELLSRARAVGQVIQEQIRRMITGDGRDEDVNSPVS
jgi:hypothetical protein